MHTNRPPHVLRTVRQMYGWSQTKLARLVGCATPSIKKIEAGQLRPSAELADRIYQQSGLDPSQLVENFDPEHPRHPMGMDLEPGSLTLIQRLHKEGQGKERIDESLAHYLAVLTLLFDVSTRQEKIWALRLALRQAIDRIINDFGLKTEFTQLLRKRYGITDAWMGLSPGLDLYAIVNTELGFAKRANAEARRQEFYEGEAAKKGQHEPRRNHRRAA